MLDPRVWGSEFRVQGPSFRVQGLVENPKKQGHWASRVQLQVQDSGIEEDVVMDNLLTGPYPDSPE